MIQVTVNRMVQCWPERHDPPPGSPDDERAVPLVCPAIVCDVKSDSIVVHYFLPDGANGACELPLVPADSPMRGRWWWPPKV